MLKHNLRSLLIAAAVLLAAGAGAATVYLSGLAAPRCADSPRSASGLPDAFRYDLAALKKVDPAWIKYRETGVDRRRAQAGPAVAAGPEDAIYVAGDRQVTMFDAKGTKRSTIALGEEPRCLAVAGSRHEFPGRVYVGMMTHVEVYDAGGKRLAVWEDLGARAELTSIAVGQREVFVADAGSRLVYRYDAAGKRLGEIGRRDPAKDIAGFIVPSPYFDVAVTADDQLRIANPGRFRVESYTAEGVPQGSGASRARGSSGSAAAATRPTSPCCPTAAS